MTEDAQAKIPGIQACFQETFAHKQVQNLVQAFARNKSAMPIRESLGDGRPWLEQKYQFPTRDNLWEIDTPVPQNQKQNFNGNAPNAFFSHKDEQGALFRVDSDAKDDGEKGTDIYPGNRLSTQTGIGKDTLKNTSPASVLEKNELWSQETIETLQRALLSYNLQAKVLRSRLTPNALLIRLKGSDRLRIEDIEKKKSVLLTTHGLTLFNIIAQPGEIVVSIARSNREIVSLLDVWKNREVFSAPGGMNLCYVLGIKEIDGEILYLNLGKQIDRLPTHAPHTLIAGTTGSGKSVLMQNLLLDICHTNPSQLAHIYLIDPKRG